MIDENKNTSNFFGKDFADALMKGRDELPVHYMNMFYFLAIFFFWKPDQARKIRGLHPQGAEPEQFDQC